MSKEKNNEEVNKVEETKQETAQEEVGQENKEETIQEEVVEEVKTAEVKESFIKKVINFVKAKWIMLAGILVAIIVLIAVICGIAGARTRAINQFIKGFNGGNISKVVNSIDFAGTLAWDNLYVYNIDKFDEEDYKDFKAEYKKISKDNIKEEKEDIKEYLEDGFEDLKDEYKSFKIKIKKIKDSKKLGKDLYAIEARVKIVAKPKDKEDDDIDETQNCTFVTYKNKIIYSTLEL